ncbi:APCL protein, partial [Aegotheles bennettii]|nr:APCL protein [Aegotheles bennettii]
LKKENSHLRRELEDNSNHLSKLENETSDMKVGTSPGWGRPPRWGCRVRHTGASHVPLLHGSIPMDITSLYNLKFPPEVAGAGRGAEESPAAPAPAPAPHREGSGDTGRATLRMLEELDRER